MLKKISSPLLIIIAGIVIYSNTLNAPFVWDDIGQILENNGIRSLSHFTDISGTRYLTYLSFALNYRINGYNVTGYHIFNIAVHILNALLMYLLTILIFKTPMLEKSAGIRHSGALALFSGIFFVSNPAYTQTLNYITQRGSLLATFFYLSSLAAFIKARTVYCLRAEQRFFDQKHFRYYLLSIISAVLAMKSKEIAFTLPFAVLFFDRWLFGRRWSILRSAVYALPILLTLLIIPLSAPQPEVFQSGDTGSFSIKDGNVISGLDAKLLSNIPRKDYTLTGLRVLLTYVRLYLLPINLTYDYDYPVFRSFLDPQVLLSLLFILALITCAVCSFYSSYSSPPADSRRLISMGIFLFLLLTSIESFAVVLNYVIFEYRLYLPSVGLVLLLTGVAAFAVSKFMDTSGYVFAGLVSVVLLFSIGAYARNDISKDPLALWKDAVIKSPGKAAVHYNLGNVYKDMGAFDKAIEEYKTALKLNPYHAKAHSNLGTIYYEQGRLDDSIGEYELARRLKPRSAEIAYNIGLAYARKGMPKEAIEAYVAALRLKPDAANVYNSLGLVYAGQGLLAEAIEAYKRSIALNPGIKAHYNLADAYMKTGDIAGAVEHYRYALAMNPDIALTHYQLGVAYKKEGRLSDAADEFRKALELKPDLIDARRGLDTINK